MKSKISKKTNGIPKMSDLITDIETIPLNELIIGFRGSIHSHKPFLCKRVDVDDDGYDTWYDEWDTAVDPPKYAFRILDAENS